MKITVSSGKGGTGKTFLSTNLSAFISENSKAVLLDLDVEEPNCGLFINGEPVHSEVLYNFKPEWVASGCTLCGKCREVCNFNAVIKLKDSIMVFPELCHSCYACSGLCPESALPMKNNRMGEVRHFRYGNLEFIDGILDIGQEQAVPLISQTVEYALNLFDDTVIISDSPPGTACPSIEASKHADHVILVTEPTPFGLHDLKLIVKVMRQTGKNISVVINRYGIGNSATEEYCASEGIDVIAKIPDDRNIAELYSKGELVYDKVPEMRAELEKIAVFIANNRRVL